MIEQNKLTKQAIKGVFIGLIIGIIVSYSSDFSTNLLILITGTFMIVAFLATSFLQFYHISKKKPDKPENLKDFEWGLDIQLKKLQLNYDKSASMIQFAGFLSGAAFIALSIIATQYPEWNTGHQIFFLISTALFITFLHFAFRWWLTIHSGIKYLKFRKGKLL